MIGKLFFPTVWLLQGIAFLAVVSQICVALRLGGMHTNKTIANNEIRMNTASAQPVLIVSRNRPVEVDSQLGKLYKPEFAVDGNFTKIAAPTANCLHSKVNVSHPWMRINLLEKITVQRVELLNREDCCSERLNHYGVYITNEIVPREELKPDMLCGKKQIDTPGKPGERIVINCNGLIGQYVTVMINADKGTLTLCEVEVFGRPISRDLELSINV